MKKHQEQSQALSTEEKPIKFERPPTRHVYLEEENIYGRFVPYLLLRDQIDQEIDSSGNTVLHHMCSHNSPYIPFFLSLLKDNDPILNTKSKMGHVPLDVAGMYCSKQVVDLLKAKGAIDAGNVDHWAIQSGNIANWSGKVYLQKMFLIHWAAYNDLPDVLMQYGRQGASLSEVDSNGYTPIDLAVLNKSYKSVKVLAEFGERPQAELVKSCDSKGIRKYFKELDESDTKKRTKKIFKFLTLPFFMTLALLTSETQYTFYFAIATMLFAFYLLIRQTPPEKYMNQQRKTAFESELLFNKQINRRNQVPYMLMHLLLIICLQSSLITSKITSYLEALSFWVLLFVSIFYMFHLWIQIYGIMSNLTYSQIFEAQKWIHLWNEVDYITERNMIIRKYKNRYDEGVWKNLGHYYQLGAV